MSPAAHNLTAHNPAHHTAVIRFAVLLAALLTLIAILLLSPQVAHAQVIIGKDGQIVNNGHGAVAVDRRYAPIEPTHVALDNSSLDAKTRLELIRSMQAEQGFAMRPLPRGHKGMTLVANGPVEPAGDKWLDMVTENGLSAKPGERVVITDLKVEHNKIVFDLNGGPDQKHRILRHIEVGGGMGTAPVVPDDGELPMGARLTLVFQKQIPELTGKQVEALLEPLISFKFQTPIEAFTATLPAVLKDAIMNHHVMVGMSTEMVLYAVGQPVSKVRETDGDVPFEEWIYGKSPKPVEFVRFNGNRVIRLEIAKVGETPEVFTRDEVSSLMRTDGTPVEPRTRTVAMGGDTVYNPDTQAAPAPPTLRKQGEKLPDGAIGTDPRDGGEVMGPVQFPKPNPADDPPVAHHPAQQQTSQPTAQPAPSATPAQPQPAQPASQQQPAPQQNQ